MTIDNLTYKNLLEILNDIAYMKLNIDMEILMKVLLYYNVEDRNVDERIEEIIIAIKYDSRLGKDQIYVNICGDAIKLTMKNITLDAIKTSKGRQIHLSRKLNLQ